MGHTKVVATSILKCQTKLRIDVRMGKPYPASAIANYFLEHRKKFKRKDPITQMKLHKLVYFAHGWHLALTDEPLIDETLQAWDYGPVVPSLYHEFKRFRGDEITELAMDVEFVGGSTIRVTIPRIKKSDQNTRDLLKRVIKVYGKFTAWQLSEMTHEASSPWSLARKNNPGVKFVGISNEALRTYFKDKADKNDAKRK